MVHHIDRVFYFHLSIYKRHPGRYVKLNALPHLSPLFFYKKKMPLGASTKATPHCPLSPVARWEPNPTWIVEPSEYRIELELPPNSTPLESLEVVVTQYRRVNHDEIRVSIMKDCERLKSLHFFKI